MAFAETWGDAALTTLSFFWMAFWAFGLGYAISAAIQVFVSRRAMSQHMGRDDAKAMAAATVFGFISSSCSFAALAAARSLLAKGAALAPALAFLLASTNLVIELGIVISLFLSWHFVVGEYVGGLILIALMWGIVRATKPEGLLSKVRERIEERHDDGARDVDSLWRDPETWTALARAYVSEWRMVWKDVTVGFTIAGLAAAVVPGSFFVWLFPGTGGDPTFWQVLAQAVIGPVAAFFTFIGSMGNIPLAGLLYVNGVSVAGIMAFIFSDLIVLPVLRVNARFYGWRMALYVAAVFLVALVATAVALHYGFALIGLSPEVQGQGLPEPESRFEIDYGFWLNLVFLAVTAAALWWERVGLGNPGGGHDHGSGWGDRILFWLAMASIAWLVTGAGLWALG